METPETRSHSLPFWRITAPGKGGAIVAVGWTGQWLATFNATAGVSETEKYPGRIVPPIASPTVDSRGPLVVSAGQQIFHSKLKPGESVRTPSLVVMTHAEPEPASVEPPGARAHNLWRALMMDHFTPRTAASDGDKPGPLAWMPVAPSAGQLTDWANESNQLLALKHLGEHNESFTQYTNTWWMVRLTSAFLSVSGDGTTWALKLCAVQDAGLVPGGFEHNGNWAETPSATYDKPRFPRGLKPVADAAHVRRTIIAGPWVAFFQERQQQSCGQDVGLKLLIWHEPERVLANTTLANTRPEWMLRSDTQPGTYLLDLSSDAVLQWLIGWVGAEVAEIGYDLYRQDFNMGETAPPAAVLLLLLVAVLMLLLVLLLVLLPGLLRTKDLAAALSVPCPPPDPKRAHRLYHFHRPARLLAGQGQLQRGERERRELLLRRPPRNHRSQVRFALNTRWDPLIVLLATSDRPRLGALLLSARAAGISSTSTCTWTPSLK